jgi:Tfp pilus assembly protein FimV
MKKNKFYNILKFSIFIIFQNFLAQNLIASEPIVVLEYSSNSIQSNSLNSSNTFVSSPNFSTKHKVNQDETLGHILYSYYGKSGLNLRIVEMAIVEFNPNSFRNRNPNFLFADQNLHLPSLNEMKNLVLGKSKNKVESNNNNRSSTHIYFFGG